MKEKWLIIGAFICIYFIWGSTYMINDWILKEMPPFLMSGSRFTFAGILLGSGLFLYSGKRLPKPTWLEIRNAVILGFVFITIGNGLVILSLEYIDSGMTALIISFDPLLIVLMMWAFQGIRPTKYTVVGMVLGITGMLLLLGQPSLSQDDNFLKGLVYIFIAMIGWGLAMIYLKHMKLPQNKGISTSIQMLGGGLIMLTYSFLSGEYLRFDPSDLTSTGVYSWIYLVLFGSILAFSSFNYLLYKTTPDKVSSSTFVNPVVALFLGWMYNSELITSQSFWAAFVLLIGVVFIVKNKTAKV